jgi:hypothetical protein
MSTKRQGVPEFDKAELDEPVFVLRAQDIAAPVLVELYALHLTTLQGVPREKVESARQVARAMRLWQETHDTKLPD